MYNPDWSSYGAREIPGLDLGPGGWGPPARGEGLSDADYIRQLIASYTTPRRRQETTLFPGGMHFGPSREATVAPGDLDTAANLMSLLASMNAERDLEERRALAMAVLNRPAGDAGNWIEAGPMRGDRETRFGTARDRFAGADELTRARGGGGGQRIEAPMGTGDQPLTRREAINLGAPPQTREQEETARKLAESQGFYNYGRGVGAMGLSGSEVQQFNQALNDYEDVEREIESGKLSKEDLRHAEWKRDQLGAYIASVQRRLAAMEMEGGNMGASGGPGGGGGDRVIMMDERGQRMR